MTLKYLANARHTTLIHAARFAIPAAVEDESCVRTCKRRNTRHRFPIWGQKKTSCVLNLPVKETRKLLAFYNDLAGPNKKSYFGREINSRFFFNFAELELKFCYQWSPAEARIAMAGHQPRKGVSDETE